MSATLLAMILLTLLSSVIPESFFSPLRHANLTGWRQMTSL